MNAALCLAIGYVLGSLSFATLLVRVATGRDIRTEGSGNAGATNVLGTGSIVTVVDHGNGCATSVLYRARLIQP